MSCCAAIAGSRLNCYCSATRARGAKRELKVFLRIENDKSGVATESTSPGIVAPSSPPQDARPSRVLFFALLLFLLGAFCAGWQITGVRHATGDDNNMQVVGHGYYGSIFRAAGLFAKRQARLQFYVKEPIILYMETIEKSRLYDVLNVTALLAMYLGLLAVLSQVIGRINSLIVVGFVMLSFPLHFFYTIPHGYPIGETYGATLALFSAAFLAQYLKSQSRTMLLLSVVLFLISLTGSEYALIVSPALVLVVYLSIRPSRRPLFLLWYAAAWLVYASAWSVHAVNGGGGRTAFGFEPEKFAESWTFLQQNAIVPIALIKGIPTNSPLAQGGPPVPSLLRYGAILP